MARSSRTLALALAAAACRAPEPPPAPESRLEPPPPAVASPLARAATGYTNEMQAEGLREEAERLGIESLGRRSYFDEERAPIGRDEGIERMRESARLLAAQRRAIDRRRPKPVGVDGSTPAALPGPERGEPIGEPGGDAPR